MSTPVLVLFYQTMRSHKRRLERRLERREPIRENPEHMSKIDER